jgi:hypothetical protein
VSTHKLKTYLARVQKRRSRPAKTELAESLVDSLYVLAKYSDYSEHRHPPTTRSDGWFIRLLFLSWELNISIVALVEGFKMLPRYFITKSTTGDSIWPTSRIHDGTALRRLFLSAGWCEDMATRIIRTYTFQTAYYLYMLGPLYHISTTVIVQRMSVGDPSSMRRATSFATKVLRTMVNATHVCKTVVKIRSFVLPFVQIWPWIVRLWPCQLRQ